MLMTKKESKKSETRKLKNQINELENDLKRNHAEFQNYRNRVEKEKEQLTKTASKDLIKKMLPILDNLELALINNKKQDDFTKGVEMIYAQLIETLEQEGLQVIKNEKFDPKLHEAILIEKGEETKIIEVLQKGYMLNDKVIRHSKIKLMKGDKK